jgi:hypothetical protein
MNFVCRLRDVETPPSAVSPIVFPIEAVDMTLIDPDAVAIVMASNEILELAIAELEHRRAGRKRGRGVPLASKEMSKEAHVEEDFLPHSEWKHQNETVMA